MIYAGAGPAESDIGEWISTTGSGAEDFSLLLYLDSARESRPSREGRAFRRPVGTED